MFGSKPKLKEGTHIFSIKKNCDFNDFIFAVFFDNICDGGSE